MGNESPNHPWSSQNSHLNSHYAHYIPMIGGNGVVLPALDLDIRNVDVDAVVADADESFRELDKFESCDVLRVINQLECLRRGSNIRNGIQ